MPGADERPQIQLRGLGRGSVRGALLVLEGASRAELRRACAHCALIAERCLLVAVDGGLNTCQDSKRKPDLFVGDGDSASRVPTAMPAVLYPRDKNFSDLCGALRELRKRKIGVVLLAGLMGGRLDHEWANLLELGSWSKSFAGILAPTDRGTVIITSRGCRVVTVPDRTFSLLALSGTATVSLRGARWTLKRRRIRPGSLGLSNVTGTQLDLSVHAGSVALVFPSPAGRGPASHFP